MIGKDALPVKVPPPGFRLMEGVFLLQKKTFFGVVEM